MKKKKTKRTRKLSVTGILSIILCATFVVYLATSLFLKSVNVSLDLKKQQYLAEIDDLKESNEVLQAQVAELSDVDRIMTIVDSDMTSNNTNVYTVSE